MNRLLLALILFSLPFVGQAFSDEGPEDVFYSELFRIEAEYRASFTEVLKKADRVIVYIVKFDGVEKESFDPFEDRTENIGVAPYDSRTGIIKEKVLDAKARTRLLEILAKQIGKKRHDGGALCHFPIHGIRIYRGGELLHEGTFCWLCKNFSFSYPRGSQWLDTTDELEAIFTALLPIPQKELDRFNAKYPREKPKSKKGGARQPVTTPKTKPEGNEKPQASSSLPSQALVSYFNALKKGDLETAVGLTAKFETLSSSRVEGYTKKYSEGAKAGKLVIKLVPKSAKTLQDCAVVTFEDGAKGRPDYDPAFLIKQDGKWKVFLKLTDWDEEEFATSDAQKKRLQELEEWFDKEKERLYGE